MSTTVNVELVISGDEFDPSTISRILNLMPTQKWKKGDLVKNRYVRRNDSTWSIGIGHQESSDIREQITNLLKVIGGKENELFRLQKQYEVEILILVTINVYDSLKPVISFNHDILTFANAINATIDVDMYNF
ncbi:DUF4279 domain-containing protein [Desulfosporosinus sp. BICA1-9]|uniref:DUF4279 domain-containing protein n=1 Tax=Desulfosporosinus sp. BICA1-9 TaxID=1531958 RepID=UPI00054BDDF9|nr:DUF4279 domain-containing protein [Desulfosporosinus sp. BICA1-9]KJS84331.1 MAG: hypothetical protein JL57_20735 [Desulfosporosinus sp. BICA1-9]HBW36732.1 DUF4279 domain-containing protein [Desulfosporosinus sp.]